MAETVRDPYRNSKPGEAWNAAYSISRRESDRHTREANEEWDRFIKKINGITDADIEQYELEKAIDKLRARPPRGEL